MRVDEVKQDDLVAQSTDWMAVEAKKEKSRTTDGVAQSVWSVTWLRKHCGELQQQVVRYNAEHRTHLLSADRLLSRRSAYPSGGFASFKRLTIGSEGSAGFKGAAYHLGLKSYNDHLSSKDESIDMSRQQQKASQCLHFAFGRQFVVVERINQRNIKKIGVVQTALGDAKDFAQVAISRGRIVVDDAVLTGIIVKLLAQLQFYHNRFDRVMLDIKPSNLLPIFDDKKELVDIHFIDLDDAVKNSLVSTRSSLDKQIRNSIALTQKTLKAMGLNSTCLLANLNRGIDYRMLSNALRLCVRSCTASGVFDSLSKAMHASIGDIRVSAQSILDAALSEYGSERLKRRYMKCFEVTYQSCQQRWQQAQRLQQSWHVMRIADAAKGAQLASNRISSEDERKPVKPYVEAYTAQRRNMGACDSVTMLQSFIKREAAVAEKNQAAVNVAHLLLCVLTGVEEPDATQQRALDWAFDSMNHQAVITALEGELVDVIAAIKKERDCESDVIEEWLGDYIEYHTTSSYSSGY